MDKSSQLLNVPGARYRRFTVDRVIPLPELQVTLLELTHHPSGAQVMHLEADDDENLFCLSFRTYPEHSSGVAHILEHTVLCGSKRFPIRDPFFSMSRRSLNTFMNALTGPDFTCYPAATQVPKDFYNLLDVYLDAVFHPLLKRQSFLQEGHRLEFEIPDDPTSSLQFKGIVFNEMKGALASGEARLGEDLMHALFPDLTYGVNSGGDPKEIPKLTYEELKAFHANYYHPSRCLFFFYGNLPLCNHLDFIADRVLDHTRKEPPLLPIPPQKRFSKPRQISTTYPVPEEEELEEKTFIAFAWLTCSILEQEELLALSVLELVLLGTDASPLKMALLKSDLCKQVDSHLDAEMSEAPFVLICKGSEERHAEKLEQIIRGTLGTLIEEGLPPHLIEGAIHQIEIARSEITGNSSPYGLSLFFRAALLKQHGGFPEDGLKIHTLFAKLCQAMLDPNYFTRLIEKHLLKNPHFVRLISKPDKKLAQQELESELEVLKELRASLNSKQETALVKQAKELAHAQEEEDPVDILPCVTLSDVPRGGKEFQCIEKKAGNLAVFTHTTFTNQLFYADLVFELPEIAEEDLSYFRLFTLLLPQMGCGGRNYRDHLDYILQHTGGLGVGLDLGLQADDPSAMRPLFALRGKSLSRKASYLLPLYHDIVSSADFTEVERIQELLMQHFHGVETSIKRSSLRYAVNLAASGFSTASRIHNSWYGLEYYYALKEIIASFEKKPLTLIEKMQALQSQTLSLEGAKLVVTTDEGTLRHVEANGYFGLQGLAQKPFTPWTGNYTVPKTPSQGRFTASPVAFTTLLFPTIGYTHPDAALLSIAAELLENTVLHKRIREQGGAYGGGAVNALISGQFYFFAYRDPHLASTVEAFEEAVASLANGEFGAADLEEAKLGVLQELDSPIAPGSRGNVAFSRLRGGRTPGRRASFREKLINATEAELERAARMHLVPGLKNGVLVSFAGKELLERESTQLKENKLELFPL